MSTVNYLTARSSNLATFNTVQLNVSTLTGSTIQTTATATTSSIVVSTLTTRSATCSTMIGSTMTTTSNVGIGTNAPSYLVDMYGSNPTLRIRTSTAAYTSGTATILFDSITTQYPLAQIRAIDMGISPNVYRGDLVFYYQYNTTLTEGMRLTNTGNLGVGTASPTYQIDTPGYMRATSGLLAGNGTAAVSLQLFDVPAAAWQITTGSNNLSINNNSASWTNRLTINQSGQVGIGTPSPSQAVDVMGAIRSNSTENNTSIILTSTYGAFGQIECYNYNNVNNKLPLSLNAYGGNVGIGLTNPSQKLEVSGTVRATGYNLSGYTMLLPKMVYVGSQVLNGAYSGTTSSGAATFPVIIGSYNDGIIAGPFPGGSNPDTSQYFKAYYVTCQLYTSGNCGVGVAINNTVLINGSTWSSGSFLNSYSSGFFLNWTQFPTQGAYGYQGNGLNLQIYQANSNVVNFSVNYITVHCVYLHTSYTTYPTVSGLTYNSSYQQFN